MNEDSVWATDYCAKYAYYDRYDGNSKMNDVQELGIGFSWPNVMPCGIVPNYYFAKIWPTGSDVQEHVSGFVHILGLNYDYVMPGCIAGNPQQVLQFYTNIVYNDGAVSAAADHDWSHANIGVSTPIELCGMTVTPGMGYQISMDDSVNTDDELFFTVKASYSF